MKRYYVQIPMTGIIGIEVEANSREEAIEEAFQEASLDLIEEWDCHDQICEGNIFHGLMNDIDVIEQD